MWHFEGVGGRQTDPCRARYSVLELPKGKVGMHTITARVLQTCLAEGEFLDDVISNFYLKYLTSVRAYGCGWRDRAGVNGGSTCAHTPELGHVNCSRTDHWPRRHARL